MIKITVFLLDNDKELKGKKGYGASHTLKNTKLQYQKVDFVLATKAFFVPLVKYCLVMYNSYKWIKAN